MNFDMTGEMLEMEDVESTTVLLADYVVSATKAERGHHRALAAPVYHYFAAHPRPLFHIHVHASFLMRVPVLLRPDFRTGFEPAFTTEAFRCKLGRAERSD